MDVATMTIKFYQINFNVIFFKVSKMIALKYLKIKKYSKYINQQIEGKYLIWQAPITGDETQYINE